jgi:hypothetical protein
MSSQELLLAKIAELEKANAMLKASKTVSGGIKVSTKGGVSVYGLGRWPITLYKSQWDKLLSKQDEIKAFIEANKALLKEKEE